MSAHDYRETVSALPGNCVAARFLSLVAAAPDYPALISPENLLSYAALAEKAASFSAAFAGESGKPVSILSRSIATTAAAMLGALFSGRPYVVIDPDWPEDRISYVAGSIRSEEWIVDSGHEDAAARLASSADLKPRWITSSSAKAASMTPAEVSSDALAYIAFTSGSTGRPKGVIHTHANLLHEVDVHTETLGLTVRDRFTLLYSPSAVGCVRDLFGALLNGATLLHFPFKERGFGPLADFLREHRATLFHAVPEIFRRFAEEMRGRTPIDTVRVAFLAGDRVRPEDVALVRSVFGPACQFYTGLGSSEANSLYVHHFVGEADVPETGPLPVGRPVPGKLVEVLDDEGRPASNGVTGEIVVRSRFISPGYWNEPEMTRASFGTPEPTGELRFRTGDFGAWNDAGLLVWHGRRDQQAKINGVRIDLQEVETVLRGLPGIRDAVVRVIHEPANASRLAAYFVSDEPAPAAETLRENLTAKLHGAAVPTLWFRLDAIPLNPNGKLDASRLPTTPEPSGKEFFIPTTSDETALLNAWMEVLRHDGPLPANIPFGLLGGDSLAAVQLTERLSLNPGITLSAADFARGVTLAMVAERLRAGPHESATVSREESSLIRKMRESWAGKSIPPGAKPIGGGIAWRWPGAESGVPLCWFGGTGLKSDFLDELARRRPLIRMSSGMGLFPFDPAGWEAPVREIAEAMKPELPGGCDAGGWCSGGQSALVMARTWLQCGIEVRNLWLVEVFGSRWARYLVREIGPALRPRHRLATCLAILRQQPPPPPRVPMSNHLDFHRQQYPGAATLIFSERSWNDRWLMPGMGWRRPDLVNSRTVILPGKHDSFFEEPHSRPLFDLLTSTS